MKNRTKILSLIALGLVVVLGASLYSSGGALQGKFGMSGSTTKSPVETNSKSITDKDSTIKTSPYYLTVKTSNNYNGPYVSKHSTSSVALGDFSVTLGKDASTLDDCAYTFGVYNDGTMYPWIEDTTKSGFFMNTTLTASDSTGVLSTMSLVSHEDNHKYHFVFPSTSNGKTYTYTLSGKMDPDTTVSGAQTSDLYETNGYEPNTAYVYLTSISCSYDSSQTWHTWDVNNSQGQNSEFSVASLVAGRGLYLSNVVVAK